MLCRVGCETLTRSISPILWPLSRRWVYKLQRVLNAAARVITGTRKFDLGLTQILHNELHWLDVPQRVTFKLRTTVYKCLHGLAPKYLADLCVPVAEVAGWRQLRSASRSLALTLGIHYLISYELQSPLATFKRSLKTFLFEQIMHLAH